MIAAERRHTDPTVVELELRPDAARAPRFREEMARIIDRGERRMAFAVRAREAG